MNCNHMEVILMGIGAAGQESCSEMSFVSKWCLVQLKFCFSPKGGSTCIIAFSCAFDCI